MKIKVTTKVTESGKEITKPVRVSTNDPEHGRIDLKIVGRVKPYVRIEPKRVMLSGMAGEPVSKTVRIIPKKGEPFEIIDVRAEKDTDIRFQLKKDPAVEQDAYRLTVTNKRQHPGRYYDRIILRTNSEKNRTLYIVVSGIFR